MYNLFFIPHRKVTNEQLQVIINIKSKAWPYNFEKQLEWIKYNLKGTDIHVLLTSNEENIAYLNLIKIELKIDGNLIAGFGIGNVCASEKGKGWGKEIMKQMNIYLERRKKIGLLFCKRSLVNFYAINNWSVIEQRKLILSCNDESVETMIYNFNNEFQHLEYLEKSF